MVSCDMTVLPTCLTRISSDSERLQKRLETVVVAFLGNCVNDLAHPMGRLSTPPGKPWKVLDFFPKISRPW